MEFEDSQFQAAPSGGDGFDSFASAAPAAASAPFAPPPPALNGALDDFFSGPAPVPEPVPPADTAAEAMSADFGLPLPADAPPAVHTDFSAVEGVAAAGDAADEDPFFQHYTPPAPAAPPPAPEVVDPRVEWRKQNNVQLLKKDSEEAAAKSKLKETAAQYLAKYYEVRTTTLTTRKANNRKSEAHQREVEVPASGTPWEKVHAMVNLTGGNHVKDVARYKALLITCKAKNVAIRAA
ncbi:hypothetical protein PLESTB_001127100 [Pleodorina starrii]|uniref:Clathrin light chain n=1 Tax=Pleodorina starrii TaxID=330485 RepID=A0A9W6BSC0_9CHLO|nr:hypothetical protein PLESTM_001364700 [Pleodorina starrii]GLC56616.1 hypothetical protein PLESTB_001127100 [Pleodorina starrii]GLC76204.1 hypothetical protein PLESTF_001749300 [Pleodorina starrii]